MNCPYCHKPKTKVLDTRENEAGSIRRRRECKKCKKRFTTYEKIGGVKWVEKKNGKKEAFNKDKIIKGMTLACEKRPVDKEKINEIADQVEVDLEGRSEVKTKEIGKLILKKLKKLDNVCYIRFASVHNEFDDVDSFSNEIKKMNGGKK